MLFHPVLEKLCFCDSIFCCPNFVAELPLNCQYEFNPAPVLKYLPWVTPCLLTMFPAAGQDDTGYPSSSGFKFKI
jgi:hypothetical protein